jgi:hypothetical protein
MQSDGPIETISFPSITFSLIKLRSWIVSLVYRQNEDGINIFVVPCNSYRISTDQLHLYVYKYKRKGVTGDQMVIRNKKHIQKWNSINTISLSFRMILWYDHIISNPYGLSMPFLWM